MIFNIGRATDNDYVISNANISRYHCKIDIAKDVWRLIDLDSKNNSFVNDLSVKDTRITEESRIRLGDYQLSTPQFWIELKDFIKKNKVDFSKEMDEVLKKMKNYESERAKVIKDQSKVAFLLRMSPSIIAISILLFYPELIPENMRTVVIILATTFGAGFSVMFGNDQNKRNRALEKIKLNYENQLVCPKCSSQLISHGGHTYWSGRIKCHNSKCDATFK